jgi:hypothetical protein
LKVPTTKSSLLLSSSQKRQAMHGTRLRFDRPSILLIRINKTNKQNVVDSTITALMYQKVSEKTSADLFAAVVWVVRDRNFQVDRTKN